MTEAQTLVPGLAGVPVAESAISFIDGTNGILAYRGIRIEELAENSTFEETSFLLLNGRLPTGDELATFESGLRADRAIRPEIIEVIRCLPKQGHPMDALQAAVAALGMYYPAKDVQDSAVRDASVRRLIAKLPTIIATFDRVRRGEEPVAPRDDLSHAANFLYMLTGSEPDPEHARVFDACLVLHADHTMNASTFAARVTASTLADPYTVVSSAIGSLSGPLHGGANERVLELLESLGGIDQARAKVEGMISRKEKIMGFGHRVYKVKDPRAKVLQTMAGRAFGGGEAPLYQLATTVERVVDEHLGEKGIYPNVDYFSGIVYSQMGITPDLFTPIFAMSRVSGWLAHWVEQLNGNRIYRPGQIYVGEHDRNHVPVTQR